LKLPSFTPKPKSFVEKHWTKFFLAVGIPLLLLSLYFVYDSWQFIQKSEKTTGVVVDYHEGVINKKGRKRASVAPIVEFKTHDAKKHLYYHDVYSRPPMYDIGEEVDIYYDKTNPDNASFGFRWFLCGILGGLGILFTGFGMAFRKVFK
jgi:hypothetical protein